VAIADVLVANKTDMADVETLEAFRAQAGKLFPPKSVIAEVRDGLVDVSGWMPPSPSSRAIVEAIAADSGNGWDSAGWTFRRTSPSAVKN
jgi:hypothetical protein